MLVRLRLAPCAGMVFNGSMSGLQPEGHGSNPCVRFRDCGSTEEHDVAIVETRVRLPPVAPVRVVKRQTRRSEGPVPVRACGFESHLGHQVRGSLRDNPTTQSSGSSRTLLGVSFSGRTLGFGPGDDGSSPSTPIREAVWFSGRTLGSGPGDVGSTPTTATSGYWRNGSASVLQTEGDGSIPS